MDELILSPEQISNEDHIIESFREQQYAEIYEELFEDRYD